MDDVKRYLFRMVGLGLIVTAAVVGAATCGDQWGRDHAGQK